MSSPASKRARLAAHVLSGTAGWLWMSRKKLADRRHGVCKEILWKWITRFSEPTMPQRTQQIPDVHALRQEFYNATVVNVRRVNSELIILRVRPDQRPAPFQAGQYTIVGLGIWEPRLPEGTCGDTEEAVDMGRPSELAPVRLVRRAYSISCSLVAEDGTLVRAGDDGILEFYVALIQKADRRAALTPRLFALHEGDRLFVGSKFRGTYTLERITDAERTIVFMATGCGEAPHNAMISELLRRQHRGKIVSVVCARRLDSLAYLSQHQQLQHQFENYRYLPITTREAWNLDTSHPQYLGRQYIQDYFALRVLEKDAGVVLEPENTHVFLCGNPAMIGIPIRGHNPLARYPTPPGMVELLERRGFVIDHEGEAGNIHFEKYW